MRKLVCALSILFSSPVWAGVVYNWQTIDAAGYAADWQGTPATFTGTIEIDDDAWRSGSVSHANEPICFDCGSATDLSDPSNPVLRFAFNGHEASGSRGLDIRYRTGEGAIFNLIGEFNLSLAALATGSIYADSGETTVIMASSGSVWTINVFASDAGPFCYEGPPYYSVPSCTGVTGLWVLDLSTIPVPAPATLALVALGMVVGSLKRRHR